MQGKAEPIQFVYRPRGSTTIPEQPITFSSKRDAIFFAENIIESMSMIGVKSNRYELKKKRKY